MDQRQQDRDRVIYFLRRREAKNSLTEKEDAEEAHRRARVDSLDQGPESTARQRLSKLRDKARIFKNGGPRLTRKERTDLRLLRLLYPQGKPYTFNPDNDLSYHPLRDEPLAEDGNLYPQNSKLRPLFEEFVDVPPYVYGHPGYPGHRWSFS